MYNQTYDNEKQIHLAAPSMAGKKNFFFQIKSKHRRYRSNSIERSKEHNCRSFQVDNICILFLEYLQGQTNELHIDIRRIGINEIPSETNEQISNWLYQRFSLKDK